MRILALGPPSLFCPTKRDFRGHFRAHFVAFCSNLPYKENDINPCKTTLLERSKCFLLHFGNLIIIWCFLQNYKFLPFLLLVRGQKKQNLEENITISLWVITSINNNCFPSHNPSFTRCLTICWDTNWPRSLLAAFKINHSLNRGFLSWTCLSYVSICCAPTIIPQIALHITSAHSDG